MLKKLFALLLLSSVTNIKGNLQDAYAQKDTNLSYNFSPKTYTIHKIPESIVVDGVATESAWQHINWTDPFLDIQGINLPTPRYDTKAKLLWDDEYLYIFAQLEEPHVWATIKERDAVIFQENNFEIFIDPDGDTHNYFELEINALGTFWDLMLTKPYRTGGRPLNAWDIKGLKVGIDIQGTLNDPSDTDEGWTLEIAIPLDVLNQTIRRDQPEDGSQWRLNFSRVEWQTIVKNGNYVKRINPETGKPFPEDNWVWSPQGVIDMHLPERWGIVQFSDQPPGSYVQFSHSDDRKFEWLLRELFYRQRSFHREHDKYTKNLKELNAIELFDEYDLQPVVQISTLGNTYTMSLTSEKLDYTFYICEDSRAWKELKN